jgi:hypothetical protein
VQIQRKATKQENESPERGRNISDGRNSRQKARKRRRVEIQDRKHAKGKEGRKSRQKARRQGGARCSINGPLLESRTGAVTSSTKKRPESKDQKRQCREQRAGSRERRIESREQRAESREQRAESREQRAESR